jgi:glutamate dehydrogenase
VLEASGQIDRRLEALPSSGELDRRARDGLGLTVPELSVLLAYAKIWLGRAVVSSDVPDDSWVQEAHRAYFPAELGEGFGDRLEEHPLRREIVSTVLVNDVVDTGGVAFAFRAAEETGSELPEVVRAFAVADQVFGLKSLTAAVDGLDGRVAAEVAPQVPEMLLRQDREYVDNLAGETTSTVSSASSPRRS